jgi:hypothetical protein
MPLLRSIIMNEVGELILQHLAAVAHERRQRAARPALGERVDRLKAFQQARFARTHADLLAHTRYGAAARFFLNELYGPQDFSGRDTQFARIVPALVRMFPHELVQTVETLAAVHALSERLDTLMGRALPDGPIARADYVRAWQACAEAPARERQIELVLQVGQALDHYTRNRFLRHSLRLMRQPARLAGLGSLQTFLEAGFDAFAGMKGAEEFLRLIREREHALARRLFDADAVACATADPMDDPLLGQLP